MKIVADIHIPFVKEYFSAYGDLVLKPGRSISHEDVKDADMLLVRSVTHVDKALLNDTPVKFVGSVTAGKDHLDTKWMEESGIVWSVATGFNAPPVADYVVSVVAALQRKQILPSHGVKAAVLGVGNVGNIVAERLKLFNFDLVLSDPLRAENEAGFFSTPLEALSDLDLISLHVPLTKVGEHATFHFIDQEFLSRQKPGCVLLNASRGSVIDSKALMQYGEHLHWCLDVWEHEPKIDKAILAKALIATPHIAGYSVQSKIRGLDMIYRIACEKKIIQPQLIAPLKMPHQQLAFAGPHLQWHDIVLGIFNPLVITEMMRTILLPESGSAHLFDEMRNQFNYRYEFGYTQISGIDVLQHEKQLLEKLGIAFTEEIV